MAEATAPPRGIWRVLRWIRRIGVVAVAVALLAVGLGVALSNTDWGRDLLRGRIEAELRAQFPGGAKVGRLEGSIFNTLTLFDLELDGRDGKPMVKIGAITVDAGLRPLASKRVEIRSLVVDGLVVDIHPQPPDPTPAPPAPASDEAGEPSPWTIELPRIELHDARIAYAPASGDAIHVDGLDLVAAVRMPSPVDGARVAPPIEASLWTRGTWRERGPFELATTGAFDRAHATASVPLLAASLAGATLTGVGLRADLGGVPSGAGVIAVRTSRATLTAFGVPADAAVPGDGVVDAVLDVAPVVARAIPGAKLVGGSAVVVALSVIAGPTQLRAVVTADLAARVATGLVTAEASELTGLSNGAVGGAARVIAAIEARPTGAHGLLTITADTTAAPPARALLAVDATLTRLIVSGGIAGAADARAAVLAEIARTDHAVTLTRGRLGVRVPDPARASGGRAVVRGAVWLEARGYGALWPQPKLVVDADAGATDLAYAALGAKSLRLHVDATGVPMHADAVVHLDVSAPHSGTAALADASLDLRAIAPAVALGPADPILVQLVRHRVRTRAGVELAGAGGRVTITPALIDVRDLRTGVGASRITASGSFAPRTADLAAQLDITDLSLAALAPTLAGTIGGAVAIARRGGRWSGGGDVSARGLVAQPGRPPVDADVHVDVAGTRVSAHATASNAAIFAASLDVDLDGPRDLTDVAGWQLLPRRALHTIAVGIERLDVDAALTAAGVDPAALAAHGGAVTGSVTLTEAGAAGEIDLAGLQARSGAVDAKLTFAPGAPAEIGVAATVTADQVGVLTAALHAAPPAHLFAPAEWAALDRGALRDAVVTLADQPFDGALLARFGVTAPYHGRASVALATTTGAARTTLVADIHELAGGPIMKPIALHADAQLDADGLVTAASATAADLPLFAWHATAPVTLDRVLALGAASVKLVPVAGELTIATLELPHALEILGRRDITAGTLAGAITVGGTLGTPTANGQLAATGVTVVPGISTKALPRLDKLVVELRWGGVSGELHAHADESNGGALQLDAAGGLADPSAATFDLRATALDIAPLAAFAPDPYVAASGTLAADLHLRGLDPSSGALTGSLTLTKARVPLAPTIGTLRQLDASVTVHGARLEVTAAALLGAGDVHVTGTLGLAGASPSTADLQVKLHQVALIGSFQPMLDGDVDLKLSHQAGQWGGHVQVDHATVIVQTSKGNKLLAMGEPSDMEFVDAPPPPPTSIHLDAPEHPWLAVMVDIAPTAVTADEVHAVVKAKDLKVSYGDEIGLDGDVDMDRGNIELFGRQYQVELGLLVFDGGTDPELNISISHAFPDVTTYADVSGRLSAPVLELHADPSLYTQGQLLGFLLGGDPGGDPSSQARDEAATVGASIASAYFSQKLNKVLPVKVAVRCNPSTSSASALCTAGKWLSEKLYVGYQQHLDPLPDENTGELDLEYYLLSHIVLDLSGGDRNDGIDLLWRKRW